MTIGNYPYPLRGQDVVGRRPPGMPRRWWFGVMRGFGRDSREDCASHFISMTRIERRRIENLDRRFSTVWDAWASIYLQVT